jgi:hypothetical protein
VVLNGSPRFTGGAGEFGEQARANDLDNFEHVFDPKALDAYLHRMERNSGIASDVLNSREMRAAVMAAMMREVLRESPRGVEAPIGR